MSDILLLYAFTRLDSILLFSWVVMVLGGFCLFICALHYFVPYDSEQKEAALKSSKIVGAVLGLALVLAVATPSKSDMAIIVGGKIALDASRSDTAKEIGQEVLDAIRAQLKKAKE